MLGLTTLGTIHTAIAIVGLIAGFVALFRYSEISTRTTAGMVFFIGTALAALTGLGIFQHGGFGNPHVLSIVTLVILAAAFAAERRGTFGRQSVLVSRLGYLFALFLHFIPGTVETLTRLPRGAPYLSHPEDPRAFPIIGTFFAIFVIGAIWQILRVRRAPLRPA